MAEELKQQEVERFWPAEVLTDRWEMGSMTAAPDGEYVRWEDYEALRAQLPSQGGEAVSLELVENLKYGGMHIRKWENLSNLGAGTHKLYTRPADQVADDLTMVKVPRELLENCADYMMGSASARVRIWHDQCRALLEVKE